MTVSMTTFFDFYVLKKVVCIRILSSCVGCAPASASLTKSQLQQRWLA